MKNRAGESEEEDEIEKERERTLDLYHGRAVFSFPTKKKIIL